MVKDNNEQHKIPEGGDRHTPSEREKWKKDLKREHDEAINFSKKSKAEILHELEKNESHAQKESVKEIMRQTDAPEVFPENATPEKNQLDALFREIKTDDAIYDYSRTLFPKFTQLCESSRLGKSFPRDILGLALGIGDSLLTTLKLAKDAVIDVAKIIYQPQVEFQNTKQMLEDTIA